MPERISISYSKYNSTDLKAFQRIRGHTKNALTKAHSNLKNPERYNLSIKIIKNVIQGVKCLKHCNCYAGPKFYDTSFVSAVQTG
jgi:hypothetical protein